MRLITHALSGAAILAAATAAQAHPGHSTQMIHSHDAVSAGAAVFAIAALVTGGALLYGMMKRHQQNQTAAKVETKKETNKA